MKRVIKIIGFVILGIVLLIVLLLGILLVKNYMDSQKPWLEPDYYTQFQSDAALEKKYAGLGSYEVSSIVYPSEDDTKAQEAAMFAGSMFGWQTPAADPRNYDEQGQPIKPRQKDRGEAR